MKATAREPFDARLERIQPLIPGDIVQVLAALMAACRSLAAACDALAKAMRAE
jgi:hypothetical protein